MSYNLISVILLKEEPLMFLFKNQFIQKIILAHLMTLTMMVAHAGKPLFILTPLTVTNITMPSNSTSEVRYSVTNNTKLTRTLTIQPLKATTQLTTAGSCSSPFTLAPNQSCRLVLSIDGQKLAAAPVPTIIGGPVVCKTETGSNNPDPFYCAQPTESNSLRVRVSAPSRNAPISLSNSPLSLKTNGPSGTITVNNTSTQVTATNIRSNLSGPLAAAGVTQTGSTCASVSPNSSCTLTFTPGGTDVAETNFPIFGDNTTIATGVIGVTSPSNYAFITNYNGNTVTKCTINPSSGTLDNCSLTGSGFDVPYGVAVNNGYAYIANSGGSNPGVVQCTIDPITGELAPCILNVPGGPVPSGIGINNGYVYILSIFPFNSVTKCTLNPSDGSLSNCAATGGGFIFTGAEAGIGFKNGFAYVTTGSNNEVFKCDVDLLGELSNCGSTGFGYSYPAGIAIANDYGYVSNFSDSSISQCLIAPITGIFTCTHLVVPTVVGANGMGYRNGFVYIANINDDSITKCALNPDNTLNTATCVLTGSNFTGPAGDIAM
jgi:hypothetical protein